jgi:hypothetical protein
MFLRHSIGRLPPAYTSLALRSSSAVSTPLLARLFATDAPQRRRTEHSPRSAGFSPLAAPTVTRRTGAGYQRRAPGGSNTDGQKPNASVNAAASPYRTRFPEQRTVHDEPPVRRPYEKILTIRKKVRVSATGKHAKFDAYCLAGDRNGSVGYAHAQSTQANKAVQAALRLARGRMRHYPLFEGRTLFHDIEARHRKLRIGLWSKPAGTQLVHSF